MKAILFNLIVFAVAYLAHSGASAQTFPSNYIPISPQVGFNSYYPQSNSPAVLPGDLIASYRSSTLPGGNQDISTVGFLPLNTFASQSQVSNQLHQQDIQNRHGIAIALVMTDASMPSAPGRTSWNVNTTEYKGEQALGGALAHRFDTSIPLAIHVGFAASGSTHTVSAGLQGEF